MKKRLRVMIELLLVLAVLVCLAGPPLWNWAEREVFYPRPYQDLVERESAEFGLRESLVYAVIKAESGFDEKARSHAGAHGLMQLTEQTFQWIASLYPPENGGSNILDPVDNVHCGCALLDMLQSRYGSLEVALCAYNAGMGTVDGWLLEYSQDGKTLSRIPYPETAAYVKKVERYRDRYEKLYENS